MKSNMGKTALLLVSSLALSLQATTNDDPCAVVASEFAKSQGADAIDANLAQSCLTAIPLHKDDALDTVAQLRLFLQFYSAQTYFAHPPTPQLELTAVDLNATLEAMEANITSGAYENNYAFDKAIHNLFGLYRDGHVVYESACYMPFMFENGHPIVSVANTSTEMPSIHHLEVFSDGFTVGEKVDKINGMDAKDYLMKMANEHPEPYWVDPDARYNQLLVGTSNGQTTKGLFAARSVYTEETLTLTYANGTSAELTWSASLRGSLDASSWDSTDSFYTNVCRRSKDEIEKVYADMQNTELTQNTMPSGLSIRDDSVKNKPRSELPASVAGLVRRGDAVPTPALQMVNGEIMLYVMNDQVGVLVINTFTPMNGGSEDGFVHEFSGNITAAIEHLSSKNIKRIVIDVSGNGGGFVRLGRDAVRQFFPGESTYFASNMRWNPALATMMLDGSDTNATYWDLGQYKKASDNSDFKDWNEFLGPVSRDGDYFTVIAVDDTVEVEAEDNEPLPPVYKGPQPFADEDIILLSSGMCGSTCAVFSEAFENHGVKTVTMGGRPLAKTMQTVGGIKGSQVLTFDDIAGWAWGLLGDKVTTFDYIPAVFTVNTFGTASVNLRNSWRKADQDRPIEFLYTPSMYRLMYTDEMVVNVTAKWEAAADAVWGDNQDFYDANSVSGYADRSGKDAGGGKFGRFKNLGHLIWSKVNGNDEL
ncbi:uncharacterized protein LAJ45_10225 [Morchella importuna]|uniref:Uncharacterized protein n=1 Tax=Morchella conica CCBAS932 TaxID=1392247 RepID=A0A3N4KYA5_9PEZI|nr:uncharacterized protein LAJ45_10225 [Morchella importuna]KAH8145748.1 hypothetical protein LAJ45_10225 [Morchella importuna]RPB15554.1 hypothetical protein P167DRAFT_603086 [Morchella conica CCBAS932]